MFFISICLVNYLMTKNLPRIFYTQDQKPFHEFLLKPPLKSISKCPSSENNLILYQCKITL